MIHVGNYLNIIGAMKDNNFANHLIVVVVTMHSAIHDLVVDRVVSGLSLRVSVLQGLANGNQPGEG